MKPKMLYLNAIALFVAQGAQELRADSVQLVRLINETNLTANKRFELRHTRNGDTDHPLQVVDFKNFSVPIDVRVGDVLWVSEFNLSAMGWMETSLSLIQLQALTKNDATFTVAKLQGKDSPEEQKVRVGPFGIKIKYVAPQGGAQTSGRVAEPTSSQTDFQEMVSNLALMKEFFGPANKGIALDVTKLKIFLQRKGIVDESRQKRVDKVIKDLGLMIEGLINDFAKNKKGFPSSLDVTRIVQDLQLKQPAIPNNILDAALAYFEWMLSVQKVLPAQSQTPNVADIMKQLGLASDQFTPHRIGWLQEYINFLSGKNKEPSVAGFKDYLISSGLKAENIAQETSQMLAEIQKLGYLNNPIP